MANVFFPWSYASSNKPMPHCFEQQNDPNESVLIKSPENEVSKFSNR